MNPSTLFLTVGAVAGIALGACTPHPPSVGPSPDGQVTSAGDYQVVHGWPQIPAGELLGQVSGIGVDSRSNVFVFRRADRTLPATTISVEPIAEPTVWLFEGRSGRLLGRWGAHQFAMPHGLTVDREDKLWLTDIALHQVFKYSHDGVPLLTLGTPGISGSDSVHFDGPTDVAIGADGSIYVADGYGNSRVVQFSAAGGFIREWGRKGSGPGEFNLPHSIAIDPMGRLYVADRGNARVQLFDSTGRFLGEWRDSTLGRPWAVRVAPDGSVYLVDGGDQHPPERARIFKLTRDGKVVAAFGAFGNYDGQLVWPHCLAIAPSGAVYVGDVSIGRRAQKFVP